MILDRVCVMMRMDDATCLRHFASCGARFQRSLLMASGRMIDIVLKGFALTALASIAIGAVRWLVRRPTALLLLLMLLGASAMLVR